MPQYITDNIEISSEFNREDSVEENSNKKIQMKKILTKKIKYKMRLFLYLKHYK